MQAGASLSLPPCHWPSQGTASQGCGRSSEAQGGPAGAFGILTAHSTPEGPGSSTCSSTGCAESCRTTSKNWPWPFRSPLSSPGGQNRKPSHWRRLRGHAQNTGNGPHTRPDNRLLQPCPHTAQTSLGGSVRPPVLRSRGSSVRPYHMCARRF